MKYKIAVIEILIEADDFNQASDAVAEALRPLLKKYGGENTCWIDWHYVREFDEYLGATDFEGDQL